MSEWESLKKLIDAGYQFKGSSTEHFTFWRNRTQTSKYDDGRTASTNQELWVREPDGTIRQLLRKDLKK